MKIDIDNPGISRLTEDDVIALNKIFSKIISMIWNYGMQAEAAKLLEPLIDEIQKSEPMIDGDLSNNQSGIC